MAPPNAAANDLEPDKGQGAQVAQSSSTDNSTDKFIPSIEQLSDITDPEHWDAEDLQELVDRYGCVAGFPDGTFKGEQPASRFEVATLIKACLDLGISIHEGNHTHDTNNTPVLSEPTPHPHEPAEHGHDTVAEHEHLIDSSGHTHEDIVPHPHDPAEHEHNTIAEHEHPINPYILINIIAFIIYQLLVFMKIRKLEKDMKKILQKFKPSLKDRLKDLVVLISGITSIIVAIMPFVVNRLGFESQEAGQRPIQQETTLPHGPPG